MGMLAASIAWPDEALKVGVFGLPRGMGNPTSSTAISEMHTWGAIFDSLTRVDGRAQVLPMLATDWVALDEHTWRFQLREGVSFSNGEPFDARAVVESIEFLLSDEGAGLSVAREIRNIDIVRAISSLEVELTTSEPTLILPALLAGIRIVAPDHWARLGPTGFARDPVGTGPFRVVAWEPAEVTLVAFERSWRAPRLGRLELLEIPDPAARLQGVVSGQLDVALGLSADDIELLEQSGQKAHVSAGGAVTSLTYATTKPGPLQSPLVRKALNYAVDKEAIVSVLFHGLTRPASQPVPHYVHGYNPDLSHYPYDPQRARELLEASGHADGFDLVVEVAPSGPHASPELYGFIRQQLGEIGVRVEVRALPVPQMIRNAISGTFSGSAFSMTFDSKPSLDGQRGISLHSCLRAIPWHCDRSLMPLIEAMISEFDADRREALLKELMRAYHDDPPALYLFESVYIDGLRNRIRDYNPTNGLINYHEIHMAH